MKHFQNVTLYGQPHLQKNDLVFIILSFASFPTSRNRFSFLRPSGRPRSVHKSLRIMYQTSNSHTFWLIVPRDTKQRSISRFRFKNFASDITNIYIFFFLFTLKCFAARAKNNSAIASKYLKLLLGTDSTSTNFRNSFLKTCGYSSWYKNLCVRVVSSIEKKTIFSRIIRIFSQKRKKIRNLMNL